MASSFTSQQDIEKPAVGEQSGIWGATLNRNFDKIDAKMSRVLRINANTGLTLTTSQTAVAQFDSQVIRCSGTLTASREIILPTSKTGRFTVDTSDVIFAGHSLSFKVAGDRGVSLTSISDRIFGIYSTGTSVRREGSNLSPFILDEVRMWAPRNGQDSTPLPFGWYVCNGANGTIDLRGRFIRANATTSGWTTANASGGASNVVVNNVSTRVVGFTASTQLTSAMIPKHRHNLMVNQVVTRIVPSNVGVSTPVAFQAGGGESGYSLTAATAGSSANRGITGVNINGGTVGHRHAISVTVSIKDVTIALNPLHYSLVFIQYKGV